MTLTNKTKLVLDRLAKSLVCSLEILIENRYGNYCYSVESLGAVGGYSGRQSLAFCIKLDGKHVLQFGIGDAEIAYDKNRIAIAFDGDPALAGDAIVAPLALLDWDRSNMKDEIALRNALWKKANMLFDRLLVLDGRAPVGSVLSRNLAVCRAALESVSVKFRNAPLFWFHISVQDGAKGKPDYVRLSFGNNWGGFTRGQANLIVAAMAERGLVDNVFIYGSNERGRDSRRVCIQVGDG